MGLAAPAIARGIAFPMIDWMGKLERRLTFRGQSDPVEDAVIAGLRSDCLTHAPEHMATPARRHTGFPVTVLFGVGAVAIVPDP